MRNDALTFIANREGKPDLVERFDNIPRATDNALLGRGQTIPNNGW